MRRGISYIEVIISISLAMICFITIINLIYISFYNNEVSKQLYMSNLLSQNMIVDIENIIKSDYTEDLLQNNYKLELKNFDKEEYFLEEYDYLLSINKNSEEDYVFYTNENIIKDLNTDISFANIFTNTNDDAYDIIIEIKNSIKIAKGDEFITIIDDDIFIDNNKEFTNIYIKNDDISNEVNLILKKDNTVFITINNTVENIFINKKENVKIRLSSDDYKKDYYLVTVIVFNKNGIERGSNYKPIIK